MTKIIFTITSFLICVFSVAQVIENRDVTDFNKLQVSNAIDVSYTVSNTKSVKVETDDKENLKYVKTEVENGTLKLYVDTKDYLEKKTTKDKKAKRSKLKNISWVNGVKFELLKITVSGPNLGAIKASSSANVTIENTNSSTSLDVTVSSSGSVSGNFKATDVTIDASSSGDFSGNVTATSIEIKSSSSSDVDLSGKATIISAKASSSSKCNLKEFTVENAILKASSSAAIVLIVTKSIEAKASSSASINYYGNPSEVKKEESSSGAVRGK
jgi:hypothetical protein